MVSQTDTGLAASPFTGANLDSYTLPVASTPTSTSLLDKGSLLNAMEAGNTALAITSNPALA